METGETDTAMSARRESCRVRFVFVPAAGTGCSTNQGSAQTMWIGDTLAAVPHVINPRKTASSRGPAAAAAVNILRSSGGPWPGSPSASLALGFWSGRAGRPVSQVSQNSSRSQRDVTGALHHPRGPIGKNRASSQASQPGRPAGCKKTGQGAAALFGITVSGHGLMLPLPRHAHATASWWCSFFTAVAQQCSLCRHCGVVRQGSCCLCFHLDGGKFPS